MTTKEKILAEIKDINYAYNDCSKYGTIKNLLEEMAEERKKGTWIKVFNVPLDTKYDDIFFDRFMCSNCTAQTNRMTDFCPCCGADMRE